jgi:thiosulfate dehydrogenase (quinone) large subunit
MSTTASQPRDLAASLPDTRRAHLFALLRILFGVVWSIDAAYKWVPAFREQTLQAQFAHHLGKVSTPVIHQWIDLWYHVAVNYQNPFGYAIAVIETLIAIGLLAGCYSRLVFVGGAIFSAGIWTAAEGMGLPIQAGQTDIGTSCIYVLVYIALFLGAAGSAWSVDAWVRGRGGKVSFLRG